MNKKQIFKKYAAIVLGVAIASFAVAVFYTPNKIVSGGVSGVSTIIYHTFGISQGTVIMVINLILLLIAFKPLGKNFVLNTAWTAALFSLLVDLFSYIPPITNDVLLASVFGSVLYGIGIGLTLVSGTSTGGMDVLARLVQKMYSHVKIGTLLLVVDMCVIFSSLLTFRNIGLSFYGIIALFISSFSINLLIEKLNISKLAFVVSDKGYEISDYLVSKSTRGVTILDSRGGYTMNSNNVLICALKERETVAFQKRVLKVDPQAFIIFSESSQIVGNGFRVYK